MDRMGRMTKMTRAAARSLAPAAWREEGTAAHYATVPGSRAPFPFRPIAQATPLPRWSSSSSC